VLSFSFFIITIHILSHLELNCKNNCSKQANLVGGECAHSACLGPCSREGLGSEFIFSVTHYNFLVALFAPSSIR